MYDKFAPKPRSVKLRFQGHGLGDTMQLSIVLKHLRWVWPETKILVESEEGTQQIFHGLCDAQPVTWPWQHWDYERGYYLHWEKPDRCYAGMPSTKVSRCLEWVFQIHPQPAFYEYNLKIKVQDYERVDKWLATLPLKDFDGFVLLHYKGTSRPHTKNLSEEEARLAAESLIAMGYLVILLDWSPAVKPEPLINGQTIVGPHALWRKDATGTLYADVGTLGALIDRAQYVVGIDSGPEHVAAATSTPTFVIWKENHPIHCFDLAPNVYHFVPPDHESKALESHRSEGLAYFRTAYRHEVVGMGLDFFATLAEYCELELDEMVKKQNKKATTGSLS